MKLLNLTTRSWEGHVMGTEARLLLVTDDPKAGHEALVCAAQDLEATEKALSGFWEHSELSRLNRSGSVVAGERLLVAVGEAIRAYEWSGGLLDPRVIVPFDRFGYGEPGSAGPPPPVDDMASWVEESGRVSLPPGVHLDLAGVGKALGIAWAATHLAGHAGLLVNVGGDIVALGTDEEGEPWRVAVVHDEEAVGMFAGLSLAIATSTAKLQARSASGRETHHPIDPRTGAPADAVISSATVAAPTILEANLTAKLLIIDDKAAFGRFDDRYQAIVTDRRGRTKALS